MAKFIPESTLLDFIDHTEEDAELSAIEEANIASNLGMLSIFPSKKKVKNSSEPASPSP